MNLEEHLNQTRKKQADLRAVQQKRDRGLTYGNDYKHPCMKVNSSLISINQI